MITDKGYKAFMDILHTKDGYSGFNFAQKANPTWHFTIYVADSDVTDGIPRPTATVPYIDIHRDLHSPNGDPFRHIALDYLPQKAKEIRRGIWR